MHAQILADIEVVRGERIAGQLADPGFKIEYVILVANQFGRAKLNVFGFGKMAGMDYSVGQ